MTTKKDHAALGYQYAQDIVAGRILVSKWVMLAMQRHLSDLARQGTEGFPYRFDPERGARVCRFVELYRVFEGPLAGQNIDLMPWQCALITILFGWLNDGGPRDGKRRFRRAYVEVPRGNAKSTLGAALAQYAAFADGEGGAQVVSAGTSRDVAKISFLAAQEMARREPEVMRALGVEIKAHSLIQRKTASRFIPISADAKNSDGKNLHLCLVDEVHAFKTRALYDSLETAMAKRDQSLMLAITTAGFDTSGIAYELRTYLTKILDGEHVDESTFGIIYTVPEGREDDWLKPEVWEAANPGWGVMVMPEAVQQLATKAKVTPSAINNFRTKHLNVWCGAASAWMDMPTWRKGRIKGLSIEHFKGEECWIGLDLATRVDLTGKVYIFRRYDQNGRSVYYMFAKPYVPELTIRLSQNSQYKGWETSGHLIASPGEVTDFSNVEEDLLCDAQDFDVKCVAYDPWQAEQLSQRMRTEGLNMVEVRMNVASLSEPMKELESLVRQRRLHHDNPVLDWCIGNVTVKPDRNENIYPRKEKPENKIDLSFAAIMALAVTLETDGPALTSLIQG